jgi:hypothetical protein
LINSTGPTPPSTRMQNRWWGRRTQSDLGHSRSQERGPRAGLRRGARWLKGDSDRPTLMVIERGVHGHGLLLGVDLAATARAWPRSMFLVGGAVAGTPSKKARSLTWFERSSIRSAGCSRTHVAAPGAAASACACVSHRLIDRQLLSPVSASPYRMKPSWTYLAHVGERNPSTSPVDRGRHHRKPGILQARARHPALPLRAVPSRRHAGAHRAGTSGSGRAGKEGIAYERRHREVVQR